MRRNLAMENLGIYGKEWRWLLQYQGQVLGGIPARRYRVLSTDLSNYLNCRQLTALDVQIARGNLERPKHFTAVTKALREKGLAHEQAYLEHLQSQHANVAVLPDHATLEQTLTAMRAGADVIFQAHLAPPPSLQ